MLVIRYEVRTELRISVWVVTDVTLQALLRTLLKKLRDFLRRKISSCCDSHGRYAGLRLRVFYTLFSFFSSVISNQSIRYSMS